MFSSSFKLCGIAYHSRPAEELLTTLLDEIFPFTFLRRACMPACIPTQGENKKDWKRLPDLFDRRRLKNWSALCNELAPMFIISSTSQFVPPSAFLFRYLLTHARARSIDVEQISFQSFFLRNGLPCNLTLIFN
jgi:hypothetical protein